MASAWVTSRSLLPRRTVRTRSGRVIPECLISKLSWPLITRQSYQCSTNPSTRVTRTKVRVAVAKFGQEMELGEPYLVF